MSCLINVKPATQPIAVQLPNGEHIWSSHTALLDIPALPLAARVAHIFPKLTSASLLSIGLLCDHGCTAVYRCLCFLKFVTSFLMFGNQCVVLTNSKSSIFLQRPATTQNRAWTRDFFFTAAFVGQRCRLHMTFIALHAQIAGVKALSVCPAIFFRILQSNRGRRRGSSSGRVVWCGKYVGHRGDLLLHGEQYLFEVVGTDVISLTPQSSCLIQQLLVPRVHTL
jgi:hypothetical protein